MASTHKKHHNEKRASCPARFPITLKINYFAWFR
jgi:hypothetical protein